MTHSARVLMSLIEPLIHQKYHVLCYNSRGNGRSTGWTSFTGFKEAEDLKAVVNWSLKQVGNIRSVVILVRSLKSLPLFLSSSFKYSFAGVFIRFSHRLLAPCPSVY